MYVVIIFTTLYDVPLVNKLSEGNLPPMSQQFEVTLISNDVAVLRFSCADKLSIMRGALLAGIELSAGCMQGRCQICRARLYSGTVKSLRPLSKYATVDPAAMPDGSVLPCSIVPRSDVIIAPRGPWRIVKNSELCTMLNECSMPIWD